MVVHCGLRLAIVLAVAGQFAVTPVGITAAEPVPAAVDATSLRGKVMCGYQGWFRCPGDGTELGWVHWSRDRTQLTPATLSFEMWPDMREFAASERFAAPGFAHADGSPAVLFSSAHERTVQRHFEWLRDYGIDGAWLQQFVVELPGGPLAERAASRHTVLEHVRDAARATGRVWAITYDLSGMPADAAFDVLTQDWKRMVDYRFVSDARYLQEKGQPVVEIYGFFPRLAGQPLTPELANRLLDFFAAPGPYQAVVVGGGTWDWRTQRDPAWQKVFDRLAAYMPWNIGNYATDAAGDKHAATTTWAADLRACKARGATWIPTVYPGFGWDNLQRKPAGSTQIARRGGRFLWEQFHELDRLAVDTVFVAMFDEVDEGTAVFKVSSDPPAPGTFVGYEGLPSDWYLRLVGEATRRLHGRQSVPAEIPLKP